MVSLKTDVVMDKNIQYSLREDDNGNLYGRVELFYRNNGTFTWYTTRYRDYVRIYVPQGSTLIRSDGAMVKELSSAPGLVTVGNELNKTYFGAFIVVEPGNNKNFSIDYKLPDSIAKNIKNDKYNLTVQKQSGVNNTKLNVDLKFIKPIQQAKPFDMTVKRASPSQILYKTDLNIDREFNLIF